MNLDINKIFSKNIKTLRKRENFTQKDLAKKLGYSEKTIAKWESGKALPTMETFVALSILFNVSVDYFLKVHCQTYFLGIDGGGTCTKYSLADEEGNVISRYIGKATNPNDYVYQTTIDELKDGISKICQNISYDCIVLYAGISGLKSSTYKNEIIKEIKSFGFKQSYFKSDIDNALATGISDNDGIVAIIGTGITIIQQKNNKIKTFGGWGYLIDEGGSGYNIGLDALKRYFSNIDGLITDSSFSKKIEQFALLNGRDLCSQIYKKGKVYIASFAKFTLDLAKEGDEIALKIVKRNVSEAAKLIIKAIENFDKNIQIKLTGSVVESELYFNNLKELINQKGFNNISIIDCSLADGAVKQAMQYFYNLN